MNPAGKNLFSDFLRYVSATVASLMVFSLYSMVDGLMVSWGAGEYAMSAVNLAIPYTNALFSIAIVFAVGTSTRIAILLAQKNPKEAHALFSQNMVVLLTIGAVMTAGVLVFLEPFALLLGAEDATLGYVKDYLSGLVPFSVCFLISYNLEVLIKTDGFPRTALFTVITGCLANCVLDYIAIFHLHLGVFGAAVATGLSQLLTVIIYIIHFMGKKATFRLQKFKLDFRVYKKIIPIGISDGVTELCTGVMIFLFNRTILTCIGTDGLISYTIIAYINTIIINIMSGVSQGTQPLVSYHHGKEDVSGCKKLLGYGLKTVAVITPVIFVLLYLFAPQIVHLFIKKADEVLIASSIAAFRHYSISYLMVGTSIVIGGFLTAVERPIPAICISTGRGLILQSMCLFALASIFGGDAIWYTPFFSEAICLTMALLFLRRYYKSTRLS